jgi:hypothetical protein
MICFTFCATSMLPPGEICKRVDFNRLSDR